MACIKSVHDDLIRDLLKDDNYKIFNNGTIVNKKGKKLGYMKKGELKHRNKAYLYLNYKGYELKINRIMYAAFKGRLVDNKVVHHIDGDSFNNKPENLMLVTQQKNCYLTYNS